ncbi:JAB domain-containing protein [Nonomuraea rubra]|uniref:DNA repair protein RadC n=1 Tax=Nonomuraea rubra TaxID=46180 RepID=A0A7X0TWY0_9ACTN|nr:DNA repair protein RadC [Nonomuraea rubra]MBB6546871.1 DNA repair protein RadC [Nonomuraea rubra]
MRVTDLPEADRPRERLLEHGPRALAERELLALVLGEGRPGVDVIELASRLLADHGGLAAVAAADPGALQRSAGIGPARAARLTAVFELARRAATPPRLGRITATEDIAVAAAPLLRGLRHERAVVVVCDAGGRILKTATLTDGAADRTQIPVRDVLSLVLALGGARFAVAHNHPSGRTEPSEADVRVTARLREAATTVGLRLLDHVIVTETSWARIP